MEEKKWVMEGDVGRGWMWPPWEVKEERVAGSTEGDIQAWMDEKRVGEGEGVEEEDEGEEVGGGGADEAMDEWGLWGIRAVSGERLDGWLQGRNAGGVLRRAAMVHSGRCSAAAGGVGEVQCSCGVWSLATQAASPRRSLSML